MWSLGGGQLFVLSEQPPWSDLLRVWKKLTEFFHDLIRPAKEKEQHGSEEEGLWGEERKK